MNIASTYTTSEILLLLSSFGKRAIAAEEPRSSCASSPCQRRNRRGARRAAWKNRRVLQRFTNENASLDRFPVVRFGILDRV